MVLDDLTFETFVKGRKSLVVFMAPWAGVCNLVDVSSVTLPTATLDIDSNPKTPEKYGVKGVPLYMIFEGGRPLDSKVGLLPPDYLNTWINTK